MESAAKGTTERLKKKTGTASSFTLANHWERNQTENVGSRLVIVARDAIYCRALESASLAGNQHSNVSSYERVDLGLEALRGKPADVAILDVDMPDLDGLDYIPDIIGLELARRTVIFSSRRDERTMVALSALCWNAWIDLSGRGHEELSIALTEILRGRRFISKSLQNAQRAIRHYNGDLLTPREALVFSILGEGLDNDQASERLKVSSETIRTQRGSIMRKLRIHQIGQLILRAQLLGYTRVTDHGILHPGFERLLRK